MKKSLLEKMQKNARIEMEIVLTTQPLILREGYESLTIREICANANITTGMFYRHFNSKDEVLVRCFLMEMEEAFEEIDRKLSSLALEKQITILLMEMLRIYHSYGAESFTAFINRSNTPDGIGQIESMAKSKIEALIGAAADKYPLSKGKTSEMIWRDLSILVKGLITNWYMNPDEDILLEAEELLCKMLPVIL